MRRVFETLAFAERIMKMDVMERLIFPVAPIIATVIFFATKCVAETITFGPTPYLSEADSPFDLSGLETTFFLEDFEDSKLNTPGVSPIGAVVRKPSSSTDSVDGDDGLIDGNGTLGYSLEPTFGLCSATVDGTPSCSLSLGLDFDPVFDGQLPNAFGFVLTDNASLADITLTAYDAESDVIAIITESGLQPRKVKGACPECSSACPLRAHDGYSLVRNAVAVTDGNNIALGVIGC